MPSDCVRGPRAPCLRRLTACQFTPLVADEPGVLGATPRAVLSLDGDTLLLIGLTRATSTSLLSRFPGSLAPHLFSATPPAST
ncbi:MAG: hypothetical protein IPK85_22340 [Gemmatimonadetes bacterium]|nr:hypothetical protein [Gemmatimonadota bacterium]